MGIILSRIYEAIQQLSKGTPKKILMLGLDAAGKTTILYKVKFNEAVTTIPTIGFNVEEVRLPKGLTFTVWDVGGQGAIRRLWHHYFRNSQGLIFVVDSNDRDRLEEAREELHGMLESDQLRDVPLVVMANKQDLPNAMSPAEIADGLCLGKLSADHKWHIQGVTAITGDGIYEGLNALGKLAI